MLSISRIRFSMSAIMMFVLTAGTASALYVKILRQVGTVGAGWKVDLPSLFLLGIGLTAVALSSWKEHTAFQTMLQMTLTCTGCLILIWIGEAHQERLIRYWFQGIFAATVCLVTGPKDCQIRIAERSKT